MDYSKYDAILYISQEEHINENDRKNASQSPVGYYTGNTPYVNWDDPKLYGSFSFGRLVQSALNGLGDGFSAEVTDFNKWVVVKVSHHDIITGRDSSKTFLIVFQQKGDGIVLSTNNKWRSISGAEQAISYIRSISQSLKNSSRQKL